jgi:hypothetical protein
MSGVRVWGIGTVWMVVFVLFRHIIRTTCICVEFSADLGVQDNDPLRVSVAQMVPYVLV